MRTPPRHSGPRSGLQALGLTLRGLCGLATLATALSLAPRFDPGRAEGAGPLDEGSWRSFANGDRVAQVLPDGDTVWAASLGGGVLRWHGDGRLLRQYLAPQDGLPSNQVRALLREVDGSLWAATEGGLAWLPAGGEHWQAIRPQDHPDMPSASVTALAPDGRGGLWVGFEQVWDPTGRNPRTGEAGAFSAGGLLRYTPQVRRWSDAVHVPEQGVPGVDAPPGLPSENVTVLLAQADGSLWVGTRPYFVWEDRNCGGETCSGAQGSWIQAGGGLAARKGSDWTVWPGTSEGSSCYPSHVTALSADAVGRVWVGTVGHGALVMRHGLQVKGCQGGQAYYLRPRLSSQPGGLRGNTVWSLAVGADGRVWMGQGDGTGKGLGIAVLDHRGSFDDSSACRDCPAANVDDVWEQVNLDGQGDDSRLVSAMSMAGTDLWLGTRDDKLGDGDGLRRFRPADASWTALRHRDQGPPSNHIVDLAYQPQRGEWWVATAARGVARFDGRRWQHWPRVGGASILGAATANVRRGQSLLPIALPDRAAFDAAFPSLPGLVQVGDDPTIYQVSGFKPASGSLGPWLELSQGLAEELTAGSPIRRLERGPASDGAGQLAVAPDGGVWVGGHETLWQARGCSVQRQAAAACWADGGLAHWDGQRWMVYNRDNSPIPDQEVGAVTAGTDGRIWIGTGNGKSEGSGLASFDPRSGTWTVHQRATVPLGQTLGSNGTHRLAVDPLTGHVWAAHHSVVEVSQDLGGTLQRSLAGGGVSRWDGARWSAWTRQGGARLNAYAATGGNGQASTGGEMSAILVDRTHDRVWAGAWNAEANFHWLQGYGLDATLNWCPLATCDNGSWESLSFPGDGKVSALGQDRRGLVWVGTQREGAGLVPPVGGLRLYDGRDWYHYLPANSGLVDQELTAIASAGLETWVGSLASGISVFREYVPPTPTTTPTASPSPSATVRPGEPSPTPEPSRTATPSPTATTTPTPRPTPFGRCQSGRGACRLLMPALPKDAFCRDCPGSDPSPSPWPSTPTAAPPSPTPTLLPRTSPSTSPTATSTASASATRGATAAPSATATATLTASATSTATPSPSATVPPSSTPSPTTTATVTSALAPLGSWQPFSQPGSRLPNQTLYAVHGTAPDNVWMVGAGGQAWFWDGKELLEERLGTAENLRTVEMVAKDRGFLAGENGLVMEMRSGRWVSSNSSGVPDTWRGLSAVLDGTNLRAWMVGNLRGNRLYYNGQSWIAPSPDDRNTGRDFTAVGMVGLTRAYAVQGSGGGRIYVWDGGRWNPGASVGPMRDLHIAGPTLGVMGGDNGNVYRFDGETWTAMPQKPLTLGASINAIHAVADERIFVATSIGGLFAWDGSRWATLRGPVQPREVHGLWMSADGRDGWAVGADGLLLRYRLP